MSAALIGGYYRRPLVAEWPGRCDSCQSGRDWREKKQEIHFPPRTDLGDLRRKLRWRVVLFRKLPPFGLRGPREDEGKERAVTAEASLQLFHVEAPR